MRLLATEHGYYQLVTIQRFDQDWERQASLRLRAGDAGVLAEYDQRGRILEGTREQMAGAACRRWLADHLSRKTSLLLAATSSQAADLARRARDELVALGRVSATDVAELYDGNEAGTGDLIVARQNTRITAGEPGRKLANRDVLRIDAWSEVGEERVALVRRITGHDRVTGTALWSKPFGLSEAYISEHAELAYAANIHVVEGRTVDTAHTVADDTMGREALYVSMSRGRGRNTAYVIIERGRAADVSPQLRPAPEIEDPGIDGKEGGQTNRLAVLATILEREQAERTATETMRDELDKAASLATLAPIWAEVTRAHATCSYDATLRSLLTADDWHRYENDPERGTLARLLRTAELAGHDPAGVLRSVTKGRDFGGARSIAAVLHGRVQRAVGNPDSLAAGGYADRTPAISDPAAARFAGELASAMDDRVSLLGIRVAADRPAWAVGYLGEVPANPVGRADWMQRAGQVAAYREERGYTHETEPIGPAPERGSPELRASWHAAWTALQQPERDREIAAATDGELWSWRAAYAREIAWAPPYVAAELREAHIAEDTYRADSVHAWYRADAAADDAERGQARREAKQAGALAQEVGAYREALTEVDQARRRWHAATEPGRQRAISADAELRRRHPDTAMPPLDPGRQDQAHERAAAADDHGSGRQMPGRDAGVDTGDTATASRTDQIGPGEDCLGVLHRTQEDIEAALRAARQAEAILAARERSVIRQAEVDGADLMHRRQAAAEREAAAHRDAVRQDPAPSHRVHELERDEQELEAGM